jgi:hypothetical protein
MASLRPSKPLSKITLTANPLLKPLAVVLTDTSGDAYVASGGGGGGAVTIADGADVAEGTTTDAAITDGSAGTVTGQLRGLTKILGDVWVSASHYLKVSIQNATLAVTQSGSWVLSAGSAIIGKVGIDQTTPGTTNAVAATNFPTTVDTNSGSKSASTLRVVIATDQPQLTNKLLVTPDANSAVNVAQLAGTTTSVNSGNKDAGTLRVVLATDQPNLSSALNVTGTVTPTQGKTIKSASGSFTANTDIIAAVTSKRIKVIGYAFFTAGGDVTTILLKSNGTSGTLLWTVVLQAINKSTTGANMVTPSPSWIFATAAGEKLTAQTNQTDTIYWSISYFDDDAT